VDATPQKTGVSRPPPPSTEHRSSECTRTRARADEARRTQAWAQLREHSRKTKCWPSEAEARKLQTKAAMELRDFSGCLTAGRGLKDPEVVNWLKLCRQRLG
jgi:eukaryotic-like serine/threonine-protein kinase